MKIGKKSFLVGGSCTGSVGSSETQVFILGLKPRGPQFIYLVYSNV